MSATETASQRYATLEDWSSGDLVEAILESQLGAIAAIKPAAPALTHAIEAASARLFGGGRLIYMGAGTSGRLGALDAAELPPTFAWPRARSVILMAGGEAALTQSSEGAEDSEDEAHAVLDEIAVGANDVVIGIAASGNTPYTCAGLARARAQGALTIGVFNNDNGRMAGVCDKPICVATGSEVVAGSTRMKAGTAQKVVLNTLSTGIMIRLGYVYRGRMVEMRPTNAKLEKRAIAMVADLADANREDAARALNQADGSIKLATLMLIERIDRAAALARLEAGDGLLRNALKTGPTS